MTKSRDNSPSAPRADEPAGAADGWYAWIHVCLAAAAMIGTLPGRTHGLGLITEPLLSELDLDRAAYADINLWATLLGAAFCWPAGILLDRLGIRRVLTGIAIALGIVVVAMTHVKQPAGLFALVLLTRALGQSMLSVASLTLVGKSFQNRLGMAMGAYSLLIGVGFAISFKTVGQAVLDYGWRSTWSALGYALMGLLAPAAWLLVRERGGQSQSEQPEANQPRANQSPCPAAGGDFTVRQALATQAFWVFAIASSFYGLISSGIGLFNQAILAERGFEPETYHTVLAVSALCGMMANLSGGWAATRVPLGRLLAAAMMVLAVALASLPLVTTAWQVYAYAIGMGAAGGVVTVSFFTVWSAAFGQTHLGKIQGWAQMMTVVASAAGPALFAKWYTATGSYSGAFYALAPVVLALGFAAWITKLPRRSVEQADLTDGPGELELVMP